jgi:WD40 repeat protein
MVKKIEIDNENNKIFLSCSQDGTVRMFDLRNREEKILIDYRSDEFWNTLDINSISLNPLNSNYFIIGGSNKYVRLFDR